MKLALLLTILSSLAVAGPTIGQMAPDFTLPGNDGKQYKLSDLKGKYVVLEWYNYDCPYVEKHYDKDYKNMQTLQKNWSVDEAKKAGKELVWLSIISSAPGKDGHVDAAGATKLKKEWESNMTAILLDPSGEVGKLYEAKTTPHMFVIDPAGKLQYMGAIDDKPSANVKTLKGASNYVTAALTSLFAEKAVAAPSTTPYGCSVKYK